MYVNVELVMRADIIDLVISSFLLFNPDLLLNPYRCRLVTRYTFQLFLQIQQFVTHHRHQIEGDLCGSMFSYSSLQDGTDHTDPVVCVRAVVYRTRLQTV